MEQRPPLHLDVVAIKKEAFVSASTMVTSFFNIWPIDEMLTGASTLGLSRRGIDGNERVLHIFLNLGTGASPSDCLVTR